MTDPQHVVSTSLQWNITPTADGGTLLAKSWRCRLSNGLVIAAYAVLFGGATYYQAVSDLKHNWFGVMLCLVVFVACTCWLISEALVQEEWFVRNDLLEIHRKFGRWSTAKRYVGATLTLDFSGGTEDIWSLQVAAPAGKRSLYGSGVFESVHALGLLLAQRTGWPLYVPEQRGEHR